MSYYAADSRGYLQDVASVGGWHQFVEWAKTLDGPVHAFITEGHTRDPYGLAEALDELEAPTPSAESTRQELLTAAQDADGVLILSDGTSDEPLRTAGGKGSGNFGHKGRPGEVGGSGEGWSFESGGGRPQKIAAPAKNA